MVRDGLETSQVRLCGSRPTSSHAVLPCATLYAALKGQQAWLWSRELGMAWDGCTGSSSGSLLPPDAAVPQFPHLQSCAGCLLCREVLSAGQLGVTRGRSRSETSPKLLSILQFAVTAGRQAQGSGWLCNRLLPNLACPKEHLEPGKQELTCAPEQGPSPLEPGLRPPAAEGEEALPQRARELLCQPRARRLLSRPRGRR